MTFIRGSVAILGWFVLLVAGGSAVVLLFSGDIAVALISGLVAWLAWKTLETTT